MVWWTKSGRQFFQHLPRLRAHPQHPSQRFPAPSPTAQGVWEHLPTVFSAFDRLNRWFCGRSNYPLRNRRPDFVMDFTGSTRSFAKKLYMSRFCSYTSRLSTRRPDFVDVRPVLMASENWVFLGLLHQVETLRGLEIRDEKWCNDP